MSDFKPIKDEDAQTGGESSGSQTHPEEHQTGLENESAFPDEDEETITMLDVMEREDKLEEEATALLGNSDEKNCTYSKGYVPRQALYSCATCFEKTKTPAAVCLACSLECHEGHTLYELYTKRFFRCDCGNSKFKSHFECKLMDKQTKKLPLNEKNKYNHNFSGKYCVCDQRYPPDLNDHSESSQDDMWQCIVCEDWFHTKHLNAKNGAPSAFEELICGPCVGKLDFLHHYRKLDLSSPPVHSGSDCILEMLRSKEEAEKVEVEKPPENVDENEVKKSEASSSSNEPVFWQDCEWRSRLCKCPKCLEMYKEKECEYLLDTTDTIQSYEALGKEKAKSDPEKSEQGLINALGRMDRVAAIEAIHGYNALKEDLSNYLRKFADNKQIVREEDIHEFFDQMRAKKKPRLDMP